MSLRHDGDLILSSRVRNINGKPFAFSFAYHTHLVVSDIRYYLLESHSSFCLICMFVNLDSYTCLNEARCESKAWKRSTSWTIYVTKSGLQNKEMP